jgi:NADPH2:quinone reductase
MRAYVLTEAGPAVRDAAMPRVRDSDVLVRVHSCGLNRVDLAMQRGHVHGRAGGIGAVLGVEWAGEIVELGPEVAGFQPGDRVMCSGAGGFAEYAATDSGRVLPIPPGMSFELAAALPVALQTMHDAVVTNGRLAAGETVLVQGASSGVGIMAMQVAKVMGARWLAGSSTHEARRARLHEFGADLSFDSRDPDWAERLVASTNGEGVDLVIDQVSGALVNQTMRATRIGGRIVNVGRLGGMRAEIDLDLHAQRRLSYIGVTFRTRSREQVREITRKLKRDLWEPLVSGRLNMPIDRVFGFEEVEAALDHMRENGHFGKVVLRL